MENPPKKKLDLGNRIVIPLFPKRPIFTSYRKLPRINARTE